MQHLFDDDEDLGDDEDGNGQVTITAVGKIDSVIRAGFRRHGRRSAHWRQEQDAEKPK